MKEKQRKYSKRTARNVYLVSYKDDATAGNGAKRGTIRGKGVVNIW